MKYCQECGGPLAATWIEADARERLACAHCDKVHFENPKILVACLAHAGRRVVMCRRAHAPARGLWVPPSGFMEMGETLEAAAVREAAEEAGLSLDPDQLIPYAITSLPHLSEIYLTFRVAIPEPRLMAGPESLEVALFDETDAPWGELAFPGTPGFLRIFFEELRSGEFSLHMGMRDAGSRSRRGYRLSCSGPPRRSVDGGNDPGVT